MGLQVPNAGACAFDWALIEIIPNDQTEKTHANVTIPFDFHLIGNLATGGRSRWHIAGVSVRELKKMWIEAPCS